MTRIIGDRKEKSALDEMEEVARERNKDVAEEERLEALRKGKEEAERAKAPSVIMPAGGIISVSYKGLDFESVAPRNKTEKANPTYDKSLERIKAAGYERHPSPSEAFSLISESLEGKLSEKLKAVADDMLSGFGEWLSMAFERKGDLIIAYLQPEGIVWDESKSRYMQDGFKYDSKQDFNIADKKSSVRIPLEEMGDEFSLLVYGRKFADLPQVIREGNKAQVFLPTDGETCPVGRCGYEHGLCIGGVYNAASRGVKEKVIDRDKMISSVADMIIKGTERMMPR